jgi:hypothetical protein
VSDVITVGAQDGSDLVYEKKLERLAEVRDQSTKESNRFFVVSIALVGLYLIRAAGLTVDLTLFNAHVLNVPYGLFFFLLASQLSFCMSLLRLCDSISYKRAMTDLAKCSCSDAAEDLVATFPNKYDWFGITASMVEKIKGNDASAIFYISALLTSLFTVSLLLSPIACGIYFIVNSDAQIVTGNKTLQYWMVVVSTIFSILWFLNYIVVYRISKYSPPAG